MQFIKFNVRIVYSHIGQIKQALKANNREILDTEHLDSVYCHFVMCFYVINFDCLFGLCYFRFHN